MVFSSSDHNCFTEVVSSKVESKFYNMRLKGSLRIQVEQDMKITLPLKAESCECGPAKKVPVDPKKPEKDPNAPVKTPAASIAEKQARDYLERNGGEISVPLKEMDTSGYLDRNTSYSKEQVSGSGFSKTTHSTYSSESRSVSQSSAKSSGVRISDDLSSSYGVSSISAREKYTAKK